MADTARTRSVLAATVALAALVGAAPTGSAGEGSPLEAAEAAFAEGEYRTAYERATRALDKGKRNPRALLIAGAAGLEMGAGGPPLKKVKQNLARALEISPEMPLAHYYLGAAYYTEARTLETENRPRKGEARETYLTAAAHFEDELRVSPGMVPAVAGRASALLRAGEYERGEEAVERWIEASPREAAPYQTLAGLLVDREEIGRALELLDRVPDDAREVEQDLEFRIAVLLYRRDHERRAVELIDKIRTRDPASWRARGIETIAAIREERMGDAIAAFESFLESNPPESERQAVADFFLTTDEQLLVKATDRLGSEPSSEEGTWKLVDRVQPVFPPAARMEHATGKAIVLAAVLEDGSVLVLRAMSPQSAALGFESAAGSAVRQWRYAPSPPDRKPGPKVIRVTVDFDVR